MEHTHLRQIYAALYNHPGSQTDVDEIAKRTGLPPPEVAAGLRLLIERGLVVEQDQNIEDLRYVATAE